MAKMGMVQQYAISERRIVRRIPEILQICQNKKILHLGCADVPFTRERGEFLLHKQLANVVDPARLWGLDSSDEGVSMLSSMGFDHVLCGNAEDLSSQLRKENFEIVLAAEIIEHLANPGLFLKSISGIMTNKTELLLTTVNAFSFKGTLHGVMGREKVHEDHNYYFSYRTIKQLLGKFGFSCKEIYFYQEVEGLGWPLVLDKALAMPTKLFPILADGLIVRVRLKEEHTKD